MDSFTRYVFRQLVVGMALVSVSLTCIVWLTYSLRFVDMIVNKGLTVGMFVYMTMLLLPNFLLFIFPAALFISVVFTYNKLIMDRELVVMRAVGLSQLALAKPALILAGLTIMMGYGLSLYLLPESYRMFRELQWDIRYNYSNILLQEGTFNTISKEVTVYVREQSADGQLHGILVHDARNELKPVTLMAERGALVDVDGVPRVIMFKGNRQEMSKENPGRMSILYFDRYSVDIEKPESLGVARYRKARERPLNELLAVNGDSTIQEKDRGEFIVEAHKRLVFPVSALSYTLVGLAALISGGFSRRVQRHRIFIAIVIIVLLQGGNLGLENYGAKNTDFIPLLYVNMALPILLGYFFMVRFPKRSTSDPGAPTLTAT